MLDHASERRGRFPSVKEETKVQTSFALLTHRSIMTLAYRCDKSENDLLILASSRCDVSRYTVQSCAS
jgi:hypothetical protein